MKRTTLAQRPFPLFPRQLKPLVISWCLISITSCAPTASDYAQLRYQCATELGATVVVEGSESEKAIQKCTNSKWAAQQRYVKDQRSLNSFDQTMPLMNAQQPNSSPPQATTSSSRSSPPKGDDIAFVLPPLADPLPDPSNDRFDLRNSEYQRIKLRIDTMILHTCDTEIWYDYTLEEKAQRKDDMQTLGRLVGQGHVPSMYLASQYLLCRYQGYFGSGGFDGKFQKYNHEFAAKNNLSKEDIDARFIDSKIKGSKLLWKAATYGYEPARTKLVELGEPVPQGNSMTETEALREILKLIAAGYSDPEPTITHSQPQKSLPEVMQEINDERNQKQELHCTTYSIGDIVKTDCE